MTRQGSVELVVGPSGSGKTAALAEYRACLLRVARPRRSAAVDMLPTERAHADERLPPTLWLAPSWAVAADMREALVDPAAGALLEPGVTTFARLAAELVRRAGLRVRAITRLQRRRLLGRIIAEAAEAGRLPYFAAVAGSPGLATVVDEAIADFQRRGLAPGEIAASTDATDEPRRRDLAELHARYAERLAAGKLADDAGLLTAVAAALAAASQWAAGLELVVVDGFTRFAAAELAVLEQLVAGAKRVVVTLPGEAGSGLGRADLFARPTATQGLIQRRLRAKLVASPTAAQSWPALAHLERNLFRSYRELEAVAPAVAASLKRVHIVAASGVQAEIDDVARRVKQRLVDGAAPGEIVVAFRSTRDVADRVRHAFDDFGIPTALDASRRLAATPLVRSLTNVLRLAAEDWPYRRLLRVAGDRTLRLFDDPDGARAAIELCVRHAQLPHGRTALMKQIDHWAGADESDAEPTAATAAIAGSAVAELSGALAKLPKQAGLERWLALLGGLAERVGLLRPATGDSAANWSVLEQALRGASQLDAWTGHGDDELTLAELIELIAAIAAQAPAAGGSDETGRVRVVSAGAARFTSPRHLFVAGLSEQAFPAVRASPAGDDGPEAVDDARSAEMLLFYQLVTRPTESLTLSYPALDERGQSLPASPFLVELERAFGDADIPRTVQPLDAGRRDEEHEAPLSRSALRRSAVSRALDGERELLAALTLSQPPAEAGGDAHNNRRLPPAARTIAAPASKHAHADEGLAPSGVSQSILAGIEAVADRSRRDHFGAFEGLLASDAAAARLREQFGQHHLWSPSQLEKYAGCPFLFFGEQVLHLQPTPELALENDLARRGGVLHETLAQLYAQLRGEAVDPNELAQILAGRFQDVLSSVALARPGRGLESALREIERRQIAAWAEGFAQQDADYRAQWSTMDHPPQPAHFEVRFGPTRHARDADGADSLSTDAPFTLSATIDGAIEKVQFAGQIDRIDVGRVGGRTVFNVIDYKSSKSAAVKEAEIYAGRQLQLPLYAMAVEELLLAAQGAAPLAAGYWSVQGKGFSRGGRGAAGALEINQYREGALAPAPGWAQTREALSARVGEIVAAIRRGQFPVFNENQQCTSYCELRTICRIAHIRSLEKRWPPMTSGKAEESHAKAQRRKEETEEKMR